MRESATRWSGSSSLRSEGDRLKKAISELLANPETQSSSTTKRIAIYTLSVGAMKCTSLSVEAREANQSKTDSFPI